MLFEGQYNFAAFFERESVTSDCDRLHRGHIQLLRTYHYNFRLYSAVLTIVNLDLEWDCVSEPLSS